VAAVIGLAVAGLFWAANSFAWAFGAGRGYEDALSMPQRPEVIVDTTQRLSDLPSGVSESRLDGEPPAYRYRGFRLVLESGGRMFLVPEKWTRDGRTVVVAYDSGVRLQLIPPPKNLAPG